MMKPKKKKGKHVRKQSMFSKLSKTAVALAIGVLCASVGVADSEVTHSVVSELGNPRQYSELLLSDRSSGSRITEIVIKDTGAVIVPAQEEIPEEPVEEVQEVTEEVTPAPTPVEEVVVVEEAVLVEEPITVVEEPVVEVPEEPVVPVQEPVLEEPVVEEEPPQPAVVEKVANPNNVTLKSNATAAELNIALQKEVPWLFNYDNNLGEYYVQKEAEYGINAYFMIAVSMQEVGRNQTSPLARNRNNIFGMLNVRAFNSYYDCIDYWCSLISRNYIGKGLSSVSAISSKYCLSDPVWIKNVSKMMGELKASSN